MSKFLKQIKRLFKKIQPVTPELLTDNNGFKPLLSVIYYDCNE